MYVVSISVPPQVLDRAEAPIASALTCEPACAVRGQRRDPSIIRCETVAPLGVLKRLLSVQKELGEVFVIHIEDEERRRRF